jgi:DNA repair protein RadA/Sms
MAKVRAVFRCSECGATAPKWVGRCPGCEEWNTLVEELDVPAGQSVAERLGPRDTPVPISEVDVDEWSARATGISELDRVLGGGLVPGSVTLVGGEPGIGKSTLLLQAVASIAADGAKVLYVSAEESKQQVRLRAEPVAGVGDLAAPHPRLHRRHRAHGRGHRLDPDRAPPRDRLGPGVGVPGA